MARSRLDSLDYCAVIVDEIALEGLDGITLPSLWVRLAARPHFKLQMDEPSRRFVWRVLRGCRQLRFWQLPRDRPDVVLFNRFESLDPDYGIVVEPARGALPEDPYPFEAVDDGSQSPAVRGSCATYHQRIDVTDQVAQLSMDQAIERFGERRLAVVASQTTRNSTLVPIHSMDVEAELNLSQYVLLERIARARYHGEVTVGVQGLGVLKEPPKNLYYLRKKLLEYRLITKQAFCMRSNNGKNAQGRLYHQPRFFCEFRPKYQLLIEQTAEVLRQQPNYIMLISDVVKQFDGAHSCLKKVAKMSEFQRFIRWEMVPYRTIYPDAEKSEWCAKNTGLERSLRVYRLMDPQVNVRAALDEAEEEGDPAEDSLLKFPDQSRLSLLHSFERQAFNLLHVHGARGIDSNTLRKELGQTPLDARALLKSLANVTSAVETFREDVGRTRITKFVASRYVHMSEKKLEFTQEEQRLKSLTVKTESTAAEPDAAQLPSLSPAEPVFVVPCAPEDDADGGPPVLTAAVTPPARLSPKTESAGPRQQQEMPALAPAASEPANLTNMDNCRLQLIDPVTNKSISAQQEVISLDRTDLFSKTSSSRLVKRTRIILEIVQKLKVIDNAFSLRRMVQNSEDDQGILTKMDRKSFNRILKRLADAGLIRNYRLTLTRDGQTRQRHIITDANIDGDDSLMRSAIEQAKATFFVQLGVSHALNESEAGRDAEEAATSGLEPDVASSVKEYHRRFHSAMKQGQDTGRVARPHVTATSRNQNETYFVPKFRRLQMLQELLFYVSRENFGLTEYPDQTELVRKIRRSDPELDVAALPPLYSRTGDINWQMFISPLPHHTSWGEGWSLLCDVLIRIPLCMFLRLVNVSFYTPDIHRYMKHPVLRNLPPTHLPDDVVSCLFWKRKYMFAIHDDITRLVFMGLAQFGQQMMAKDQVFVFINRNASLLDTSISKEGYHKVDAEIQYPIKMYYFDSVAALKDYWFDLKTIALSTPLGSRSMVAGQKVTVEIPFYKPTLLAWSQPRAPDEADPRDQGAIPGDNLGASGIDSSMFAHVLRNWKWQRAVRVSGARASKVERDEAARKRRRTFSGRGKAAKLEPIANEPDVPLPLGEVVGIEIHKSSDGTGEERPIVVTRGRNVRRGTKRSASTSASASGGARKRLAPRAQTKTAAAAAKEGAGDAAAAGSDMDLKGPQRRVRNTRHNTRTKIERLVITRKKRGPKPPRDDTDKRALSLLTKQRCEWSDRENTYLLMARVALGLLSDSHKVPSRQYLTVRNALHETIEGSENKTALAVQRRIMFMLKRSQTAANVSLTIQESKLDPDVQKVLGDRFLSQNSYDTIVVFPKKFRELMAVLMANLDKPASRGDVLPDEYRQLSDQFDIVMGDQVRMGLQVPLPEIQNVTDVHLYTVIGLIVSHLSSREDKSSPVAQMHAASQRYPEELMQSALVHLRSIGVASQRRRPFPAMRARESKLPLANSSPSNKPFVLSTKFRHRFIQRYQYAIFSDCFAFFKMLLLNSLREHSATSIGSVQRGGQAALVFGLMANNQLMYNVSIPENLIRLSRQQQQKGEQLVQSILDSSADALPEGGGGGGGGAMTLGRASGGQRRVGQQRSLSRLVLLATRESQDTADCLLPADQKPGVRQDTHNYHEQLHIEPFSVLAKLAGDAGVEAETPAEPFVIDERHLPLSPLVAQAARDRLARMLPETPPELEAVLGRLRQAGDTPDDDLQDMRRLCRLLDDAGYMGLEPARLLSLSGIQRSRLCRLAAAMEREQLLVRGGVTALRYVRRQHADDPWVVHSFHMTRLQQETASSRLARGESIDNLNKQLQPVFFQPAPWRRISGTVNRRVLDRLAGGVLSQCMTFPGCSLASVQQHFHPMLTGHQTRLLVELLYEIGCVDLKETSQTCQASLFSRRADLHWYEGPADDCSPPESVAVSPAADAVLKYACFLGDKPYSVDFMDTVGL